jgi:hypothetical protein
MKTTGINNKTQIFWSELTEEQKKLFIENNRDYLVWCDGNDIALDELDDFMLIYNEDIDVWTLTRKNEDFYIEDVIF